MTSVYEPGTYTSPYLLPGNRELRFSRLHDIFQWCSTGGEFPLKIILPGNLRQFGQSTDAQQRSWSAACWTTRRSVPIIRSAKAGGCRRTWSGPG
jgi:hypothetical protein